MGPRRGSASGSVDWAEVRRRVDAGWKKSASPGAEVALLEERARALAQPIGVVTDGEHLELVSFTLANEIFAVESRYVVHVFRLQELTPLPGALAPVFGVTAWRGDLLTILDLRPVLGLSVATLNDLSRVIVLGAGRPEFGVLADAVLELLSVPATELGPPGEGRGIRGEYLRGITSDAVQVLDGPRLLSLTGPEPAERSRT